MQSRLDAVEQNLGGSIIAVADDLESLKKRVDKNEASLDGKIERAFHRLAGGGNTRNLGVGPRPRPTTAPQAPGDPHRETYKEERYWQARRSLRMWPVRGPDLKGSLSTFFKDTLKIDDDIIARIDQFEVRGVRSSKSKITNEVVVVFPDVDLRDAVRAAAYNLAGASNAGIRLEIPEFLRQSLRAL